MKFSGIMYIPEYESFIITHCCNKCGFKDIKMGNHTTECSDKPYIIFGKKCPIYILKDYTYAPLLNDFLNYVIKAKKSPNELIKFI